MNHIEKLNLKRWLNYCEEFWKKEGHDLDLTDEVNDDIDYLSNKEHIISLMPTEPKRFLKEIKDYERLLKKRTKLKWDLFEVRGKIINLRKLEHYYERELNLLWA